MTLTLDVAIGCGGRIFAPLPPRGTYEEVFRVRPDVNKHLDLGPDIPYAGAKQSGIGTELGQEGLEEFTQATIINVAK